MNTLTLRRVYLLIPLIGLLSLCILAQPAWAAEQTADLLVEQKADLLQNGGLNHPRSNTPQGLSTMSATSYANFEAALRSEFDKWNGTSSSATINVASYDLTVNQAHAYFEQFVNRNGQYFFLTGQAQYSHYSDSDTVRSMIVHFDTSYSKNDISAFKTATATALSGMSASWSDEQKALYLHDYLVTHVQYDNTLKKFSAYDALVGKSSVCQGYALSYNYLLNLCGIECDVITSDAINHAWNLVTIGGKTYYVDCTFDDPANYPYEAYCSHDNFLLTKTEFYNADHQSTDWIDSAGADAYDNALLCTSTLYSKAYWRDVITAIPHVGDLWAYVKSPASTYYATIYAHDYAKGTDAELSSGQIPSFWYAWDNENAYNKSRFTSLISNGGIFIASAPTALYSIDQQGTTTKVHELSSDESKLGFIYGLLYDKTNGKCIYALQTSASMDTKTGSGSYDLPYALVDEPYPTTPNTVDLVKQGSTYVVGGASYKVLSKSSKTVALVAGKNAKSVTIPASVKLADELSYKVTQVSAKAFARSKATKVTIGTNVTKLASKAFAGSKVKTVVIKNAKLAKKSAVKGAFKSSKVKTVKVSKKSLVKKYRTYMKKSIVGAKVTVKA